MRQALIVVEICHRALLETATFILHIDYCVQPNVVSDTVYFELNNTI